MSAIIKLDNLTLGYDGHPAVHHVSGTFEQGSMTAVVGPNGSGKSTLLKAIAGVIKPLDGSIIRGSDWRQGMAYLPQSAEIDRSFPADVTDLVALGLWKQRGLFGGISRADAERLEAALQAVGLAGFERRGIDTLSGGQLQRALFARVLLQDAKVILLDEPFTAIDERTVSDLIGLVRRWHGEGRTVIAVLHDAEMVRQVFPQTLLLARELIDWGPTEAVMTRENLRRSRGMTEAWDEHAPWHEDGHNHGHEAAQ
ncbi:zinc ABC transporter ATP-binding protein AztA [Devosia rhodophyticola]|uniref:Zinc ABC transporter ATP-binding protein AztA n=1 Tax=Devosia rhodophyticola TaxID=3026423 RepID=A0ABY7YYX7_9HYPH|nr:zinc ABC transporter ATP-binding protein AztA [Devosia rhodophyticola]WDR06603.1 zinc ABC transporter ATP-binding protein AztA [Devosia rhodophyticola]